jgi:two-component system CheB/CheR fusion protein
MTLLELMDEFAPRADVKVFATDVEGTYIERASAGRYGGTEMAGIPDETRRRWFTRIDEDVWQVKSELRHVIVFSRHDLLVDAPFTHLDLVVCRNVLIYFQPAAQDRAIRRLTYALRPGGTLFLGSSESPSAAAGHYEVLDARQKLYQLNRRPALLAPEDLLTGQAFSGHRRSVRLSRLAGSETGPSPYDRAVQALNRHYAPPSILVTSEREVMHVFGNVRRLLRFSEGDASLDVLELLPPVLMPVVATLIHGVLRDRTPHRSRTLEVPLENDEGEADSTALPCRISVVPMETDGKRPDHLLISFETVEPADNGELREGELPDSVLAELSANQVAELERELAMTQANLHDTIQELGTANEELQATNEELMASNEELQSTNEELQSVNEELHTVNAEYQTKIAELFDANADLESLTRAPALPLVFLDSELRLARFTPEATRIFRFRDSDLGRPIQDIRHFLDYEDLYRDLAAALEDGVPRKIETTDARGSAWLVTLVPHAARPGGSPRIVISAVDVSTVRNLNRLQQVLDAIPESMAVLDSEGIIVQVNETWRRFAADNGNPTLFRSDVGINYLSVCESIPSGEDEAGAAAEGIRQVLGGEAESCTLLYPCHSPTEERWFVLSVGPVAGGGAVVTHLNVSHWIDPGLTRARSQTATS